jgi:hypothetical protein
MGGGSDRARGRRGPGRRALVVALLVAGLAGGSGCAPATPAAGAPAPVPAAAPVPATTVRLLQMNLCNSGIAGCYTGRAVAEGAAVIRAEVPDLVTLNEVCADDVPQLERALAEVTPGGGVVSAFQAARNGRTGDAYRCRNGQAYGIGLVSRWPSVPGQGATGGIYPAQDPDDPEQRAWLCLPVAPGPGSRGTAVCTTHLAYTSRPVARAQCADLFGTVVPSVRARNGSAPVVLGGDLNLGSPDGADVRACLPDGAPLVDDGGEQLVTATSELTVGASRTIRMTETDHPGLLATLTPA